MPVVGLSAKAEAGIAVGVVEGDAHAGSEFIVDRGLGDAYVLVDVQRHGCVARHVDGNGGGVLGRHAVGLVEIHGGLGVVVGGEALEVLSCLICWYQALIVRLLPHVVDVVVVFHVDAVFGAYHVEVVEHKHGVVVVDGAGHGAGPRGVACVVSHPVVECVNKAVELDLFIFVGQACCRRDVFVIVATVCFDFLVFMCEAILAIGQADRLVGAALCGSGATWPRVNPFFGPTTCKLCRCEAIADTTLDIVVC